MRSVRHVLSAVALATVALGGLTGCDPGDLAAAQAAAHARDSSLDAAAANATTTSADAPPDVYGIAAAAPARPTTTTSTTTTTKTTPRTTIPRPTRRTTAPTTTPPPTTKPTTTPPPTTTPTPTTRPPTSTTTAPPAGSSVAAQILARVNAERATAGCHPVALDSRLTAAAAGHAQDMARQDYFSHTSKDGRTFVDRIKAQGYPTARSENIAAGQSSVSDVMNAWMASPGHRANILDCTARQMGAASATGGTYGIYWVQDFGLG